LATVRQDPVTGDYVIIATERAKRPKDFCKPKINKKKEEVKDCPFCPGGKAFSDLIPNASTKNVLVVKNKYPAFDLDPDIIFQASGELYFSGHSTGAHEVIIYKDHYKDLQDMESFEIEEIFRVYQKRILEHKNNPDISYSLVIHNHGPESGASIVHPHSQIFAPAILPKNLFREIEGAKEYYIKNGSCVFCDIVRQEKKLGQRIIDENEDYIAIAAYAPRFSGEVWILPKYHTTYFELIRDDARQNLAKIFSKIIKKFDLGFGDPAYNFYVHSGPFRNYDPDRYYHFHIEILPRMSIWGGFELGAGMPIDVLLPELVAEYFREIKI